MNALAQEKDKDKDRPGGQTLPLNQQTLLISVQRIIENACITPVNVQWDCVAQGAADVRVRLRASVGNIVATANADIVQATIAGMTNINAARHVRDQFNAALEGIGRDLHANAIA